MCGYILYLHSITNIKPRKDVAMPRVAPIKIVRSRSGGYEVAATEVEADVNRDAAFADCDCCCDGHCNLTHLPGVKMVCVNPFSTLMANGLIPNLYPEPEDDEVHDDVPFPGEKDDLYAVLTALETKFDLDVCQEDDA